MSFDGTEFDNLSPEDFLRSLGINVKEEIPDGAPPEPAAEPTFREKIAQYRAVWAVMKEEPSVKEALQEVYTGLASTASMFILYRMLKRKGMSGPEAYVSALGMYHLNNIYQELRRQRKPR